MMLGITQFQVYLRRRHRQRRPFGTLLPKHLRGLSWIYLRLYRTRSPHTLSMLMAAGTVFFLFNLLSMQALSADRESISIGWKHAMKEPICLTMTQDGKFLGSVDRDGTVTLYDRKGDSIWSQTVEGATDMLIARNGESVLVYSKLNPVYQEVLFFKADGSRLWRHKVDGCIWSGDVSPDGEYAAITTGNRYVYVYGPDPNGNRYPWFQRWRLDGIGYCVSFTPDSSRLIMGTWQKSELVCFDRRGSFQWRCSHDTDLQYDLRTSLDGQRILGILPGKQIDPALEIRLWDSSGGLLWKQSMEAFDGTALVSPRSQYVAVSYASFLSQKQDSEIIERKVSVYKANGQLWWEKGGLFFGPRLIALSPKGSSVIVWDGEKSLYNLDKRGKILSKLTLRGKLRKTIASDDGHRILLYCGDGYLYLLTVG